MKDHCERLIGLPCSGRRQWWLVMHLQRRCVRHSVLAGTAVHRHDGSDKERCNNADEYADQNADHGKSSCAVIFASTSAARSQRTMVSYIIRPYAMHMTTTASNALS